MYFEAPTASVQIPSSVESSPPPPPSSHLLISSSSHLLIFSPPLSRVNSFLSFLSFLFIPTHSFSSAWRYVKGDIKQLWSSWTLLSQCSKRSVVSLFLTSTISLCNVCLVPCNFRYCNSPFEAFFFSACTSKNSPFLRYYYVLTPNSLQANVVEDVNHPSLRSLVRLRLLDFCSPEGGAISKAAKVTFFNNFGPWFDPLISTYTEQVMH